MISMFYFDILPCSPPPPSKVPHKPTLNAICSIGMKTNKWTDGRTEFTNHFKFTYTIGGFCMADCSVLSFYSMLRETGREMVVALLTEAVYTLTVTCYR